MSIVLQGSTSGSVTLQEPAVAGTTVLTLPAVSGTVITTGSSGGVSQSMLATGVAGTGPAFSAYQSSGQTLSSATATKLNFQTEEFDTNNNFDSTTNMRFTPTVAGYYQVNGGLSNNTGTQTVLYIYKNGGVVKTGTNGSMFLGTVSAIIYLNGSSDYIELYGYFASGTTANTGVQNTYFQAAMIRAA